MDKVCEKDNCTGCRACLNICAHSAIEMKKNNLDVEEASVIIDKCKKCGLCKLVCPQKIQISLNPISKCFAAWSNDQETRRRSASGGVASELYKWALENEYWIAGVKYTNTREPVYCLTNDITDILSFQNSKYVSSNMGLIYREIAYKLKMGKSVLFIGLPCQVAGIKRYCEMKGLSIEKLILIDLVCHGTAPYAYLEEHICNIEKKKNMTATEVSFRDPDTHTYTFTFTLKNDNKTFYAKKVESNDTYQIGYHKGIIYRENCYNCKYACLDRIGDLTLADFSYVGTKEECLYDNKNVSCVLTNSRKGEKILMEMNRLGSIYCEERPMQEETEYEMMLHRPTVRPAERPIFLQEYNKTHNFDHSMKMAAKNQIIKNQIISLSHYRKLKSYISRIIPLRIKKMLKVEKGNGVK